MWICNLYFQCLVAPNAIFRVCEYGHNVYVMLSNSLNILTYGVKRFTNRTYVRSNISNISKLLKYRVKNITIDSVRTTIRTCVRPEQMFDCEKHHSIVEYVYHVCCVSCEKYHTIVEYVTHITHRLQFDYRVVS